MNIPIKDKSEVSTPAPGYVTPFIDKVDKNLKGKKSDSTIIEFYKDETELLEIARSI